MDTTGIDTDDPDTIVISGRRYVIPHTPERAAIAVTMKTHGIAFDLASPYDTDYRRPLDTLDDRL